MTALKTTPRPSDEALREARELLAKLWASPTREGVLASERLYEDWLKLRGWSPGSRAEADALLIVLHATEAVNDVLHRRIAELEGGRDEAIRDLSSTRHDLWLAKVAKREAEAGCAKFCDDSVNYERQKDAAVLNLRIAVEHRVTAEARATAAEARAARDAAEIERLRAALKPFVRHYEKWMDERLDDGRLIHADEVRCWTHSVHTLGDLRRARQIFAEGDRNAEHG